MKPIIIKSFFQFIAIALGFSYFSLAAMPAHAAQCDSTSVRWSASSNRIYISGPDTVCTIPEIHAAQPRANIQPVDSGDIWQVGSNIILQDGATLNIHGPVVRELRLTSNNTGGVNDYVFVRAQWGNISIRDAAITSWDEATGGPDTEYSSFGRAYLQTKSFLDGGTPRESRMDIANSDIGYLGFNGAEAYGLSWKVLGSAPGLYDQVNVYGDISNSHIHHNYFGVYTFGLFGGEWMGNEVNNNIVYGFDPHDDSDSLLIADNNVYGNGSHGIICSQRCDHLTIKHNQSHDNGGNGVMLHRNTTDSLVENNTLYNNLDSGLALFESHRNTVRGNQITNNGNGIRFSVGSSENIIEDNTVSGSTKYGFYFYNGSDIPTSGDGRPKNNQLINNTVTNSAVNGLKLQASDNNIFRGNTFTRNGKDNLVDGAQGNTFAGNTFSQNSSSGLRLINSSHDNVISDNEITDNTNIGLLCENSSNSNRITGNSIRGHSQYALTLTKSNSNLVADNDIINNRSGFKITNQSNSNQFSGNRVSNNSQYAYPYTVYLQNSNSNTFKAEQYIDNANSGLYASGKSQNTIFDTLPVRLKIGDLSSKWTLINRNYVIFSSDRSNVVTRVNAGQSATVFDASLTRNLARYAASSLAATVPTGEAVVELDREFSPTGQAEWQANSLGNTMSIGYDLGGLVAGHLYQVAKDGQTIITLTANAGGHALFQDPVLTTQPSHYQVTSLPVRL